MRLAPVLASALLLSACQSEPPPKTETPAAVTEDSGPSEAATAPPAKPTATATKIALDGEGLRLVTDPGGATRLLAFGTRRAQVDGAVVKALGETPARSEIGECGERPMQFSKFGGLQLSYLDDKLVGWTAERDRRFSTIDGIHAGMARGEAAKLREVQPFAESTLDNEFTFGPMSETAIGGFFENPGANARIASLNAGANCFFR